jgi:hypothetical protein
MYHAAYALTGDHRWFENQENVSTVMFLVDAAKLGYVFRTIYLHTDNWVVEVGKPIDSSYWLTLAGSLEPEEYADMLVSIVPNQEHDLMHMVAVRFYSYFVQVSDSAQPEPLEYTLNDFLESKYAQAVEVAVLMTFTECESYAKTGQAFYDQQYRTRLEQDQPDLSF